MQKNQAGFDALKLYLKKIFCLSLQNQFQFALSLADAYIEYPPPLSLAAYLDCYWTKVCTKYDAKPYRILPDGCMDIIFDFTGTDDPVYLVGMSTTWIDKITDGNEDYFGIRFKAGGFYPFFNEPVSQFTDEKVAVRDFSKTLHDQLLSTVKQDDAVNIRIAKTNALLLKLLSRSDAQTIQPYLSSTITAVLTAKGNIAVKKLTENACISERQLQRKFTEVVGISPKAMCNITRFKHTMEELKKNPSDSITGLAYTHGYFDHSHLSKEFKKFAGKGPF